MTSNLTDKQVWTDFDRMQQWAMTKTSLVTRKEFFAQPRTEQHRYYEWMCRQVPDHLIGRYWSVLAHIGQ